MSIFRCFGKLNMKSWGYEDISKIKTTYAA